MIIWVDAQLAPSIAKWITANANVTAVAVRDLGLRDATDRQIFHAAREASAVVLTKDADFALLVNELGPPPNVLWLRCGNTSNRNLQSILKKTLAGALALINQGEALVEIAEV